MKKMILVLLIGCIFYTIKAQEPTIENRNIVGGFVNFLTQNNTYPFSAINLGLPGIYSNGINDVKRTVFAFQPYVGTEINPNFIIGLSLNFQFIKLKNENQIVFGQTNLVDYEDNSNQIGGGVFVRYILNPENQFKAFIQPNLEYHLLKGEQKQDGSVTQEEQANFLELGIGAGLLYDISNNIRANLRLGILNYINGKWEIIDSDTEKKFNSFGANMNLSNISIGFEIRV